jgi:hypothetical protein
MFRKVIVLGPRDWDDDFFSLYFQVVDVYADGSAYIVILFISYTSQSRLISLSCYGFGHGCQNSKG